MTIDHPAVEGEPERFITSEKKNVLVDLFVKWQISDVQLYYISVNGDEALDAEVQARRYAEAGAAAISWISPGIASGATVCW